MPAPTRVVRKGKCSVPQYDLQVDGSTEHAVKNRAESLSELTVTDRLTEDQILQLSFELGISPDDPNFWDTLSHLSQW